MWEQNHNRKANSNKNNYTRKVNPKLGYLGFLGLVGFLGFWTYALDKTVFPFCFFVFFGFFGFFYEGKMSNTYMDERYYENKRKAEFLAYKIGFTSVFILIVIFAIVSSHLKNLDYLLISLLITIAFIQAISIFLSEYFLYHFDQVDSFNSDDE